MRLSLWTTVDHFPLAAPFVIARGARTVSTVVVATVASDEIVGRGECVPYGRYDETVDSVLAEIERVRHVVEGGVDRTMLQALMPAGAARNALDCALWDFEAKRLGLSVAVLAGIHRIGPATTAYTLSLGSPDEMGRAAEAAVARPLLKLKLGRSAAHGADLIVDANEAWSENDLDRHFDACAEAGVLLVEQPLPAGRDAALARVAHAVPVCADESAHDRAGLAALRDRYQAINIKLDKTGGLTEALALATEAERLGFGLMIGCMVGSSLAMAPAMLLAARARFVDLDGPLLLAQDRPNGLRYEGSVVYPPVPALWG